MKIKKLKESERFTNKIANQVIDRLNLLSNIRGRNGVTAHLTLSGVAIRGITPTVTGVPLLFRIASNATGNGIYNCRIERIDGDDWNSATVTDIIDIDAAHTDTVEVFNMLENEIVVTWVKPTFYYLGTVVDNSSTEYRCTVPHLSATVNEPGTGDDWADFWTTNVVDHKLDVGVEMIAWKIHDSNGTARWIGYVLLSRDAMLDLFESFIQEIVKALFDECT